MQGLEFMVTHDPSENDTKHDHSGVWVIRKQNRRKRQGAQDEVIGISSYYVVGENVYMAPSAGSILGSRLVCAMIVFLIGLTDLEFLALDSHLSHEATLHSLIPTQLHSFTWPYLSPSSDKKFYYRLKPPCNPG